MKKIIQLLSIVSVALVFATLMAFGQSNRTIKAEIPFDFAVGQKIMQKGSYQFSVAKDSSGAAAVTVINASGKRIETVIGAVKSSRNAGKAELVFGREGGRRFLTNVITSNYAVAIPATRNQVPTGSAGTFLAVIDLVAGSF